MSARDNLQKRLEYRGGIAQGDRNIQGKLESLRTVLKSQSYNTNTVAFLDENTYEFPKEFKALINTHKLSTDYDQQVISIPYEDVCVSAPRVGKTSEGRIPTGAKPGNVFYWKENGTYWICYLQDKDEKAYFKCEIRECKKQVEFNGHKQWVYFRGPDETTIPWNYKTGVSWNDNNYSAIIYITKTDENMEFFRRFSQLKIDGNNWVVSAWDDNAGDGVIEAMLTEDYNNTPKDNNDKALEEQRQEAEDDRSEKKEQELPYISGDINIYPFDERTYYIHNIDGGRWMVDTNKVKITSNSSSFVTLQVLTGKSCKFNLLYIAEDETVASLAITVDSM